MSAELGSHSQAGTGEPRHGRLPWPTPEELSPEARSVYNNIVSGPRSGSKLTQRTDADGRLHGPFNAMLTTPVIGEALQQLGSRIRYAGSLSDRTRELAILLVASAHDSAFERYAHEPVARSIGCTDAELEAIWAGDIPDTCDDDERAILQTVRQLAASHDLDDEQFATAHRVLGDGGLTEVIALVGYYDLLATLLAVFRAPVPDA